MKSRLALFVGVATALVISSCGNKETTPLSDTTPSSIERAIAVINPTEGHDVKGMVDFKQNGDEVEIVVTLEGLEPNSVHGWHIHEFGDLSDPNGKATGSHYNPEGYEHGLPGQEKRHAGALGNLTANSQGNANHSITVSNISINGSYNPILGRGVIIHADEDDGGQPHGNAGPRIAQGVIGVRQVSKPAS